MMLGVVVVFDYCALSMTRKYWCTLQCECSVKSISEAHQTLNTFVLRSRWWHRWILWYHMWVLLKTDPEQNPIRLVCSLLWTLGFHSFYQTYLPEYTSQRFSSLYFRFQIMLNTLEMDFTGVSNHNFSNMCASFLSSFIIDKSHIEESLHQFLHHLMNVLQNLLYERNPDHASRYNLPRYNMIIDNTNDDSVMQLLWMSSILNSSHAFFKLSGMKEGSEMKQLNLATRIKYAA